MGHESRCSPSHLKCHILGIKDRSVRTLIRLWLTLPCGRGWKGLSQEIGIHKGACVRQCWTGLLKASVTVFTTFIAAVIRRYLSSDSKHSQCLKHNHRAVRIKAFFFLLVHFKSVEVLKYHFGWITNTLQKNFSNHFSKIVKQNLTFFFLVSGSIWPDGKNAAIVYLSGTLMP